MKGRRTQIAAVLAALALVAFSGCAMDQNNVGDVYGSSDTTASPSSAQYPESMKTGTASGDTRGPTLP
ncbi:MAG TPA: hypothetical protein VGD78_21915 [Chthoniobacterales bacterium]